ncbi:hypothetical protein GGH94_002736 [Coemansia aciculifera]|uniref:DNA mismatch repair proteins mutS family domain-containing protein n=1 Tax=Coemansia aciculifera TaxID=417176 RepID=A0A9W8IIT0_9FUNG|nr:hypothetical protein GGH94_002736 [Coemansia aciculifera]
MTKALVRARFVALDISAVQVVDNMFGAAIYDTIVHQLSVMCVTQQQPTSKLALQSLIKQTLADVVLHPQGNTFDGNVGSMLSELSSFDVKFREIVPVGIEAFDFVSAEKRLFGLTENMAAAAKESIELDERINEVLVGPNASGKSVLLKQIALIVYMAHIGSPVPAKSAVVGLTDRVLAMGKTTESLSRKMSALSADLSAVAKIIELASTNSLVLLDEFGRGTAPVDGVSLLCGVLASLSLRNDNRPSVLAATHFQGK